MNLINRWIGESALQQAKTKEEYEKIKAKLKDAKLIKK